MTQISIKEYISISDTKDIPKALKALNCRKKDLIVLDIETEDREGHPTLNNLVGTIATLGLYNPRTKVVVVFTMGDKLSLKDLLLAVKLVLKNNLFICHNAQYEYKWIYHQTKVLLGEAVQIKIAHDTIVLARLIDNRIPSGLKARASLELLITGWGIDFTGSSKETLAKYNALDVIITYLLYLKLMKKLFSDRFVHEPFNPLSKDRVNQIRGKLLSLYKLELKCIPYFAQIEMKGALNLDMDLASRTLTKVEAHLRTISYILNFKLDGSLLPFNFNSPAQLKNFLYHPDYCDFPLDFSLIEETNKEKNHPKWLLKKIMDVLKINRRFKNLSLKKLKWFSSLYTVKAGTNEMKFLMDRHKIKNLGFKKKKKVIKDRLRYVIQKNPKIEKYQLDKILHKHELRMELPLVYKGKKLKQYANIYGKIARDVDGYLHFSIKADQVTGRASTPGAKPAVNFSNNPEITDKDNNTADLPFARSLLEAREGMILVFCDFKNQEVRILIMETKKYIQNQIEKNNSKKEE